MRYNKKSPIIGAIVATNDNNHAGMVHAMKINGFTLEPGENLVKKMAVLSKVNPTKAATILKQVPFNRNSNNYTTEPNFLQALENIKKGHRDSPPKRPIYTKSLYK